MALDTFHQTLSGGLKDTVRKPTNSSKVSQVTQGSVSFLIDTGAAHCLDRTLWTPYLQEDSSPRSNSPNYQLYIDNLPEHRPKTRCSFFSGYTRLLIPMERKGLTTKPQSHLVSRGELD